MKASCLLFVCWLLVQESTWAQSVILLHRPLEGNYAVEPLWNYHQDTAAFTGSAEIWGLVYCACASIEQPSIELSLQQGDAPLQIVSFVLEPFAVASANWHPSLKRSLPTLFNSTNWYTFQVHPTPTVKSGYDGVNFGTVFYEAAQSSKRQLFRYKVLAGKKEKQLTINFGQAKEQWEAIWPKYLHYKGLVDQVDNLERTQEATKAKCAPYGYTQINTWAIQAQGFETDLVTSDLELFKAVETLKIITEDLPATIRPNLKRQLHALLRLDVGILEASGISQRTALLQQKASLLKELSLYPSLQPILKQYNNATGPAVQQQRQQEAQEQALQRVAKQLAPYQSTYTRIQQLQKRLDYLEQQLSSFD
ncbi:MAG: hypothetical protein ACRBFS_09900 [Aureispira sp.]